MFEENKPDKTPDKKPVKPEDAKENPQHYEDFKELLKRATEQKPAS